MSNNYQDRLKLLNLPSLEFRRMRGDLIEVYKIIHAIYDPVTTDKLFTKVSGHSTTRKSNNLNLLKKRTNFNTFSYFFTNRITNIWNSLPSDVVNAKSVNVFKNKIDHYFRPYRFSTEIYKEKQLMYGRQW